MLGLSRPTLEKRMLKHESRPPTREVPLPTSENSSLTCGRLTPQDKLAASRS